MSFPPLSFSSLAWIALVPFFVAISWLPPRTAAVYGLVWGLGMAGATAWCLPTALAHYFELPILAGVGGLFVAGIGLVGVYAGGFAVWLSWLVRRQAASPLIIAAGWGVCEFARANMLGGNPWALLAYSQVSFTRLMQMADVAGPYGVGMLIAAVNGCIAGFFTPAVRGRHPVVSALGTVVVIGAAVGYGGWRLSQNFGSGQPVQVALVQGAIERQFRLVPKFRGANLQRYFDLTKEASMARPALIFWPEYAVDFPLQSNAPEREAVFAAARGSQAEPHCWRTPYPLRRFACLLPQFGISRPRRGACRPLRQDPFCCPLPRGINFTWFLPREDGQYEPGQQVKVLRTKAGRIGTFVCIEAMYPEFVRRFALQGAEILVNPSNDDWLGYAAPAHHHLEAASVRAIENRRYLVRPTTTGFSAVIDPHGRVIARSGFGAPEILTTSIRPSRAQTVYQRWGDAVAWIAVILVTVITLSHTDWLTQQRRRR